MLFYVNNVLKLGENQFVTTIGNKKSFSSEIFISLYDYKKFY